MTRLAAGGLVLALGLFAAAHAAGPEPSAEELVRRLGDPSYALREDAAARLGKMGRTAVAALEKGAKGRDAEVRRRCAEMLPLARRSDLEIRLDDFAAGVAVQPPLPGWVPFRELAGDGVYARRLFTDLYRSDRALLELLEKDPKQAAAGAKQRFQALLGRLSMPGAGAGPPAAGDVASLVLAAAVSPPADAQAFYQLNNICYQGHVHALARGSPAARRLLARALAPRLADRDLLMNVGSLAAYLGLQEFIDDKVKPAVLKQIESVKPEDQWRFYQAVSLAHQLHMDELVETRLKPAVRQMAEGLARHPEDQSRLFMTLNLVQTLQMHDTVSDVLRPAAVAYFKSIAAAPTDVGRMYSARYLAQSLELNEAFDALVKPAACQLAIQASQHPDDVNKFNQAVQLAQFLNLEGAFEGALRPAGRRRILADLEKAPADAGKLVEAAQVAQQLRLQDVADDTLKPLARRLAKDLVKDAPDANRICQVHNLAQSLALAELNEDAVKPALRKLLQASGDRLPAEPAFAQILQLARTLRMKEAVPVALRGALTKTLNPYMRSTAVFFVGEFGGKDDLTRLEPLLAETASVGGCGINSVSIQSELRDVVLAALVSASGQSLADYGFPYFRIIPGIKPADTSPSCAGFAGAADREAALKKWRQWSAARKK
jgi:hypothetical protein